MVKTELMAQATLHKYIRDKRTWKHHDTTCVQVSPASWVLVSAFATKRARGRPSVLTTATETALLLQHLDHGYGRPLAWTRAALAAPPHMRRFLTESAALALTLETARESGWDPLIHDVLDVDDLPAEKRWLLPDNGPRPDFVYQTGEGLRAAEARGRSSKRRNSPRPDTVQSEKVDKLDHWAAKVKKSASMQDPFPWSMTWAWMTETETHIDMFDSAPVAQCRSRTPTVLTTMETHTAELVSQMIKVSIREQSESTEVFGRHARAALRPVGSVRTGRPTEWLAVLIWQERLRQGEIREFGSPQVDYSHVEDAGAAFSDQFDDSNLEITDATLSGHIGAVLCETDHGRLPTWKGITDALIAHGLEHYRN